MSRKSLALITIALAYFLIVFGGYVASSESGMGCGPDWPLCNGEVIPELHGETLIEFGHRVIGAVLFVLTIALFVMVKKETNRPRPRKIANWMLGLFILQLVMGAIVVFYHLPSMMITIHLLIAMIYLAMLIWFWRYDEWSPSANNNTGVKKHLSILSLLLFVTIGIGAYVKHQQYGLACGYLTCGDSLLPQTIPELLQTSHRWLAILTMVYTLMMTYKIFSTPNSHHSHLKGRMVLALIVMLLQIIIGIMTIVSFVSISFAVLHLAAATLLFVIIIEARMVAGN